MSLIDEDSLTHGGYFYSPVSDMDQLYKILDHNLESDAWQQ